jgi:DNA-directed RNA polymerase specialized sigma24 family protein
VTLTHGAAVESFEPERLLALHQALERLATREPRLVQVVECRYFLGLSEAETASALGVSLRTIQRDWRAASLWLARELAARPAGEEPA